MERRYWWRIRQGNRRRKRQSRKKKKLSVVSSLCNRETYIDNITSLDERHASRETSTETIRLWHHERKHFLRLCLKLPSRWWQDSRTTRRGSCSLESLIRGKDHFSCLENQLKRKKSTDRSETKKACEMKTLISTQQNCLFLFIRRFCVFLVLCSFDRHRFDFHPFFMRGSWCCHSLLKSLSLPSCSLSFTVWQAWTTSAAV